MVEMVEKQDLGNAIALNSSMVNSARLIGPSLAGILIAAAGEGVCFLLNALSYVAVIASLAAMRVSPRSHKESKQPVLRQLREGFSYAFGFLPIRMVLLLLAVVSLVGMPYSVLVPVFARDILHGGPHTMGFLVASSGVGALIGAIYLASRKSVVGLGAWIAFASAIFGFGLLAFAVSRVFWISMIVLFMSGLGMVMQMASSNTVLQTVVEEEKRGRVMSFYTMAFRGMAPFGSLLAGSLASAWGAPNTLILGGGVTLLATSVFALKLPAFRREVRETYERLGILPHTQK
jgi:MFS family permease